MTLGPPLSMAVIPRAMRERGHGHRPSLSMESSSISTMTMLLAASGSPRSPIIRSYRLSSRLSKKLRRKKPSHKKSRVIPMPIISVGCRLIKPIPDTPDSRSFPDGCGASFPGMCEGLDRTKTWACYSDQAVFVNCDRPTTGGRVRRCPWLRARRNAAGKKLEFRTDRPKQFQVSGFTFQELRSFL